MQLALADLRDDVGDDVVLIADLCVDEYTDHGHCGVLDERGDVDNDATLEIYARRAARPGRRRRAIVAPSGMMDGQVGRIRAALDGEGFTDVAILAYSAKYASGAVRAVPRRRRRHDRRRRRPQGLPAGLAQRPRGAARDRRRHRRGRRHRDGQAGARLPRRHRRGPPARHVPLAAYHVSGEYAMIKAAAANGWIDHDAVALEHLTAIKRAGADMILTYLARWFAEGPGRQSSHRMTGSRTAIRRRARRRGATRSCAPGAASRQHTLFDRSAAAIPGGVNSSIRAFKAVGGEPYVVARAEGPYVFDVEGRRYIDLVQSYGAVILGHAHPAVTAAIRPAAGDGTSYGAPTPREMKLAETDRDAGARAASRSRLMNSGTEATSTAVRLARGFTGRDRIVSFHGNFHGATDALLAAGGSGVATLGLPGTAGVPAGAVAETLVVPYNRVPDARRLGRRRHRRAGRRQHGRRRPGARASSTGCAPSATGSAPCSSSTRSSPASASTPAAPRRSTT